MFTLIVDAGSTKTEWVALDHGTVTHRLSLNGFNPNYASAEVLRAILNEIPEPLHHADSVFYYGSGCGTEAGRQMVFQGLSKGFPQAKIEVENDMYGAARAVLGKEKGIACILGTGANSCLFDGNGISDRAVSLGYLVGDEGSGCYIGRKLVRAYFYNLMPLQLKHEFKEYYHLNISEFIDRVYHQKEASKYLAGFTKFAGEHQEDPFINQLVKGCFRDFIEVFVLRYADGHALPIGFVGSVAYHFQSLLKECLEENGLTLGRVIQSPMEGLIRYHSLD